MRRAHSRLLTAAATPLAALALFTTAGCMNGPGGNQKSDDSYWYESRPYSPKSIDLIDTRTDEVVWAIDVPVGWDLKMKFGKDTINSDGVGISVLTWSLVPEQVQGSNQKGKFNAPPRGARRVDMQLREFPEYPTTETTDPEVAESEDEDVE